jgi:hypothetical protein
MADLPDANLRQEREPVLGGQPVLRACIGSPHARRPGEPLAEILPHFHCLALLVRRFGGRLPRRLCAPDPLESRPGRSPDRPLLDRNAPSRSTRGAPVARLEEEPEAGRLTVKRQGE